MDAPRPRGRPRNAAAQELAVGNVASAPAPGCTCPVPFRVTRARIVAEGVERFCEKCGAVAQLTTVEGWR